MTPRASRHRTWVQKMNAVLRRDTALGLKALDLFCGAGGLSLGFWACGFDVMGIDRSADALKTYARNLGKADCDELGDKTALPRADVVIAGPPCQPWSRAGKRLGEQDERDGLAIVTRAVGEIRPVAEQPGQLVEGMGVSPRGEGVATPHLTASYAPGTVRCQVKR